MKVLLTGATGQLGQALQRSVPGGIQLLTCGRQQLDLADAVACRAMVRRHRPDWVLNAGAYTAVDRAEQEPALAEAVNAAAPAALAAALADSGGRLLQLSTDFVFDGAQGSPYRPEHPLNPLGVYGRTKAAAEQAVLQALGEAGRVQVLRTSWVYGPVGHNFCLTMLRLHAARAAAAEPLGVVADQVGCPTATAGLAAACWQVIHCADHGLPSVLHWSDAGAASWYDFAVAIGELGVAAGVLNAAAEVLPLSTAEYPTPAQRPSYSLLECAATRRALRLPALHWRQALAAVLAQVAPLG